MTTINIIELNVSVMKKDKTSTRKFKTFHFNENMNISSKYLLCKVHSQNLINF